MTSFLLSEEELLFYRDTTNSLLDAVVTKENKEGTVTFMMIM